MRLKNVFSPLAGGGGRREYEIKIDVFGIIFHFLKLKFQKKLQNFKLALFRYYHGNLVFSRSVLKNLAFSYSVSEAFGSFLNA